MEEAQEAQAAQESLKLEAEDGIKNSRRVSGSERTQIPHVTVAVAVQYQVRDLVIDVYTLSLHFWRRRLWGVRSFPDETKSVEV